MSREHTTNPISREMEEALGKQKAKQEIPPHKSGKPVGDYADICLGLILHAQGGEITVTREQAEAFRQSIKPRLLLKRANKDGSITFSVVDCPLHK